VLDVSVVEDTVEVELSVVELPVEAVVLDV
jgi:hypothetical protein